MAEQKQTIKIDREANLGAVVFKYPEVEEILLDYGLHCAHCVASGFDTIEMGAKVHGMEKDEIDEMLTRMNEVIEHGE